MKAFRSVVVGPVHSLEVGDLFAMEFLGGVISGKITAMPSSGFSLTDEQKAYLRANNVDFDENSHAPIGGASNRLLMGDFQGSYFDRKSPWEKHMFVDYDAVVAVFPDKD